DLHEADRLNPHVSLLEESKALPPSRSSTSWNPLLPPEPRGGDRKIAVAQGSRSSRGLRDSMIPCTSRSQRCRALHLSDPDRSLPPAGEGRARAGTGGGRRGRAAPRVHREAPGWL